MNYESAYHLYNRRRDLELKLYEKSVNTAIELYCELVRRCDLLAREKANRLLANLANSYDALLETDRLVEEQAMVGAVIYSFPVATALPTSTLSESFVKVLPSGTNQAATGTTK